MDKDKIRLGAIGFGGFAQFAIEQFRQTGQVELHGIAGSKRDAAVKMASELGIPPPGPVEQLVARDDIDLIYIATPPHLHHEQAMLALQAGKHVIVEKPLATSLSQADEMIQAAQQHNLLLTVNQMQRYNPLFEVISRIVSAELLGEVLHGYFENYASDQGLPLEHWFWDRSSSGGIFIEHGVHFFDLVAGWLGEGRVVAGQRTHRPSTGVEEQVHCTVQYGRTGLVNFYHGFTQAGVMDRQELRLVFERGDITLHDWIPRYGKVHALVTAQQAEELARILPQAQMVGQRDVSKKTQDQQARHRQLAADRIVDIMFIVTDSQQNLYAQCLREFLRDQVAWISDRNHARKVTAANGRTALEMAVRATELADAHELGTALPKAQHHKS